MKILQVSKNEFSLKKVLILLSLSFMLSLNVQAQWQNGTNIYNTNSGNVGVGTSTPIYKLDVAGTWAFRQDGYFYNSTAYAYESISDQYFHFKISQGKGHLGMNSTNSIVLQSNGGFVGIGTANPGHKLDVRGTIRGMEVKVDVNVPADYFFRDDYKLLPLDEVETFVKKNHHLPGVPSGEEIKENGWQVGEMSNILLEKVEELTLYLIELKKENEEMKKEIQRIKLSPVYEYK